MPSRWSDERVGYFNTAFTNLGDHREGADGLASDLLDTEVRTRWRYHMKEADRQTDMQTVAGTDRSVDRGGQCSICWCKTRITVNRELLQATSVIVAGVEMVSIVSYVGG